VPNVLVVCYYIDAWCYWNYLSILEMILLPNSNLYIFLFSPIKNHLGFRKVFRGLSIIENLIDMNRSWVIKQKGWKEFVIFCKCPKKEKNSDKLNCSKILPTGKKISLLSFFESKIPLRFLRVIINSFFDKGLYMKARIFFQMKYFFFFFCYILFHAII